VKGAKKPGFSKNLVSPPGGAGVPEVPVLLSKKRSSVDCDQTKNLNASSPASSS
jgi:hypothetical protein